MGLEVQAKAGHVSTDLLTGGPTHSWEQPPPQLLDLREDLW